MPSCYLVNNMSSLGSFSICAEGFYLVGKTVLFPTAQLFYNFNGINYFFSSLSHNLMETDKSTAICIHCMDNNL